MGFLKYNKYMLDNSKIKIYNLLRWSEQWTQTDMVYLTKGGFWLTLSQIAASLSSFLLAVAFANLISREVYGTYKYVLSIVTILSIPTLSGMHIALVQAIARGYEGVLIRGVIMKMRWGFFGSVGGLAVAGYYYFAGHNLTLTISFLIAAAFLPLMEAFLLYDSLLAGRKLFPLETKLNSTVNLIAVAIMISVLLLKPSVILVVAAYFISYTLLRFGCFLFTWRRLKPNKEEDSSAITYGKHLSVMNIVGAISSRLDQILLWHFLGAASVAVYSFALAPIEQISGFLKMVLSLAFPKLAAQDPEVIKKTLPAKMMKFYFFTAAGALAYVIFAPYFYDLFFPQYAEAVNYSRLFAIILLFFPQKLIGSALQAKVKTKILYILSAVNSIVRIAGLVIFLPLYGITGAIVANIIPYAVNTVLLYYYLKKI
jgi:O-antigen/teichoic acid export membrane protein